MSDNKKDDSHYHIIISIAFFCASLSCVGFYTGSPASGFGLLLIGWLGLFDYHFSWYANPLYLYAIYLRFSKRIVNIRLELIALLLAISFIFYSTILTSFETGSSKITGYGLGYYLWILSIATLFIGDLAEYKLERQVFRGVLAKVFTAIAVCTAVCIIAFQIYNPFKESQEAKRIFQEKCKLAGEVIYRRPGKVTGVYFPQNNGIFYNNIEDGVIHGATMFGDICRQMVGKGYFQFCETADEGPYHRFIQGDQKGKEVDKLESEYTVITKNLTSDIRRELNINGAEIKIIENSSQEVMAKTIYFTMGKEGTFCDFCGYTQSGRFSTEDFVARVLELSTTNQSINR